MPPGLSLRPRAEPLVLARVLAGGPLLMLLGWWAFDDGGYAPVDWQPGALVLLPLATLVVATAALRRQTAPGRAGLAAAVAFAAYTAWSYLSVAWAGDPGAALEGAHRCALYLAAIVLMTFLAPTPGVLRGFALGLAGVVGATALATLVELGGADVADGLLLDARLLGPLGYPNATAAFFTTGALLALVGASQRQTPWPLRPPLLGLAALELGLAVLTGSRGWLFTLPAALLVLFVLVPGRGRLALGVAALGLVLLPTIDGLLEPVDVGGGEGPAVGGPLALAAVQDALGALWTAGGLAVVAAAVWVAVDRRLVVGERARRGLRVGGAVAAGFLAVGGVAAGLALEPRPVDRLDRAWEDFKSDGSSGEGERSRFTSTGSSRYDFWRVAVDLTERRPFVGLGQDNFEQSYVARRAIDYEEPRWVHSLPLRALTHTGLVGALLLLAALGALLATRLRHPDPAVAALALVPLVPWLTHGSVDWLWEFPVLSVGALGLAAGVAARPRAARPAASSSRKSLAATLAVGAVAFAGTAAVAVAYVAERDVASAARSWPQDPAEAFGRLQRAAGRTPSARPALVEGVIAMRLGDRVRARAAFSRAAEREPGDWFAPFQLGLVAVEDGRRADARRHFEDAAGRNPKEPVLQAARRALRDGKRFGFAEAEGLLQERARRRFAQG